MRTAPVAAKRGSKKTTTAQTDTENASIMGTSHPLDATSGNLTGRLNNKSVKQKSWFAFSYGPKELYRYFFFFKLNFLFSCSIAQTNGSGYFVDSS